MTALTGMQYIWNPILKVKMVFGGIGEAPIEIFKSFGLEVEMEEGVADGAWSLTAKLPPKFSPERVAELVSKLSESGNSPNVVSRVDNDLATVLSAATGLTPSEVGLEVDEHLVIPLAKIGGEEE